MPRLQSQTLTKTSQHAKAPPSRTVFQPKPLSCAVHAALLGVMVATGDMLPVGLAHAQDAPASQVRQNTYALPAGPLGRALSSFAAESGILLSFDPKLTKGTETKGLTGNYSIEEGFAVLLAGTGLTHRFTNANTVTLERVLLRREEDPNAVTTLPSVTVSAERDSNLEVDEGFKADFQTSATKTPLSIKETPQSISVITRESIDARQARDLGTALELSAGVAPGFVSGGPFAGQGRFDGSNIILRGQQLDGIRDIRTDGFAVNSNFFSPDLALFERVEVIKGPSSSLYGLGSLSGFVNRVSRKPQIERAARVVGQVGSFDTYRTEFDVTGALDANDRFAGRLIGVYEDSGSFVDGVDRGIALISPSFSTRLGERTRVLLQGYYQESSGTPSVGIPLRRLDSGELVAPNIPRSRYIGQAGDSDLDADQYHISLRADHDLSDRWLATLLLQQGRTNSLTQIDNYGYGLYAGGNTILYRSELQRDGDSWAGELRLDGHFDLLGREHQALLGIERRQLSGESQTEYVGIGVGNIYSGVFEPDPTVPELVNPTPSEESTNTEAVYGQLVLSLAERTRLIAGLRYEDAQLRNTTNAGADKSKTTYRIGLSQDLTPNVSAFAAYATSFIPVTSVSPTGAVLEPETGKGIELGLKGEWFDQRLGASLAAFRQERDKVPLALARMDCIAPVTGCARSAGLQEFTGIELEVSGKPLPELTLGLAAAWTDGEFTERSDPATLKEYRKRSEYDDPRVAVGPDVLSESVRKHRRR